MKRTKKKPVGRPKIPDKKIPVSVRLSPDVVRYLRKCREFSSMADVVQSAIEESDDYCWFKRLDDRANVLKQKNVAK